jgi:hypothetical protein
MQMYDDESTKMDKLKGTKKRRPSSSAKAVQQKVEIGPKADEEEERRRKQQILDLKPEGKRLPELLDDQQKVENLLGTSSDAMEEEKPIDGTQRTETTMKPQQEQNVEIYLKNGEEIQDQIAKVQVKKNWPNNMMKS